MSVVARGGFVGTIEAGSLLLREDLSTARSPVRTVLRSVMSTMLRGGEGGTMETRCGLLLLDGLYPCRWAGGCGLEAVELLCLDCLSMAGSEIVWVFEGSIINQLRGEKKFKPRGCCLSNLEKSKAKGGGRLCLVF
ncbi:hypothetical protein NC653_031337 [Populus alba x Populus x berolinensis]|uniref:Uncharacterized protein n=1 Tax=Populus alba x Populus x berolinensis TaxID=444605 RepID=A0AAD6Q385_9ROSI|nr:hypothetical protein NC653_031337 [Populus alba x Populus x berolinensis]